MELLVVIGIIGIVLATSVPALTRYANDVRLKAATREIVGLLSLARSSAISSRAAKTILIMPENHTLQLEEGLQGEAKIVRLPKSVELTIQQGDSEAVSSLVFKPTGAIEGASALLTLASGARTQTINVSSMTGAITLE